MNFGRRQELDQTESPVMCGHCWAGTGVMSRFNMGQKDLGQGRYSVLVLCTRKALTPGSQVSGASHLIHTFLPYAASYTVCALYSNAKLMSHYLSFEP